MKKPGEGAGAGKESKQNSGGTSSGNDDTSKSTSPAKRARNPVGWEDKFDAIFFSRAAIEKFVVQFYNNRQDGEGDRIMKAYAARSNEIYAVGHMPDCGLVALVMETMTSAPPPPRE